MAVATPRRSGFRWKNAWLVAILAVVVVVAGMIGIGFGTGLFRSGNQPGPPAANSPSAPASPSALASPSQSPKPPVGPAAVLVGFPKGDWTNNAGYDVSIVGPDGRTIASAHAPLRSPIGFSMARAISTPLVNVAGNDVFYLSGDTDIRLLERDGTTHAVTTVPGSGTARAAFAVNSDETKIAVSVLDYSAAMAHPEQQNPIVTHLYVEDLRTHANHVEIFTSSSLYVWPIGWHAGKLVVALGVAMTQAGIQGNPYSAAELHVVDPITADRLVTIGSSERLGCWPQGLLTAAGIACFTPASLTSGSGTITVRGWDGSVRPGSPKYITGSNGGRASVSPDGTKLAVGDGFEPIAVRTIDGLVKTALPQTPAGFPCWIDNEHVLSTYPDEAGIPDEWPGLPAIVDIRTGAVIQTAAHGMCAAISPSDVS